MGKDLPILHGANYDKEKYRFMVDDDRRRIQLFKKVGEQLIPLTVWSYDRLFEEMTAHDD